jgi:NADH:ubiquinone oxidoreductase subunit H
MFYKSIFLVILAILIRGTLPRYRIDQVISLNWKYCVFLNVFFINQIFFLNIFFL